MIPRSNPPVNHQSTSSSDPTSRLAFFGHRPERNFLMVHQDLLRCQELSCTERVLLMDLLHRLNRNERVPSVVDWAKEIGVDFKTAHRVITALETKGYLVVYREGRKRNVYLATFPAVPPGHPDRRRFEETLERIASETTATTPDPYSPKGGSHTPGGGGSAPPTMGSPGAGHSLLGDHEDSGTKKAKKATSSEGTYSAPVSAATKNAPLPDAPIDEVAFSRGADPRTPPPVPTPRQIRLRETLRHYYGTEHLSQRRLAQAEELERELTGVDDATLTEAVDRARSICAAIDGLNPSSLSMLYKCLADLKNAPAPPPNPVQAAAAAVSYWRPSTAAEDAAMRAELARVTKRPSGPPFSGASLSAVANMTNGTPR